ncbi:MAG: hypothetical protein ACRELG_02095 [Gemmataceae bacterium]
MTPANSHPSQSVQESPSSSALAPFSPERIPLPEQTPSPPQADLSRADLLLASLVILLAFLLSSTPARNSDIWLHLATGRALADGSYRFQGDPFSHDTTASWIAHSWLFDLATYEVFLHLGGMILVILKAGLVAVLAALLVRLGTRERGLAWPAVAATLALLAMCGRLLLQPALLSALLLVVTLTLLERGRRRRAAAADGWLSAYGPVCLLFVLWANLEDWFLLGPLTLGLYLIGEGIGAIAGGSDKDRADLPGLALTLGLGLLACLLTPFHLHGFTVPPELGLTATAKALKQDAVLQKLFVSPFEERYFHSGAAWSIPGLAYLALVVLSALSFVGSRDAWRSWRLPVWLGLFGLSAWNARAVPFFAVTAGPILALNAQDLARRYRPDWLRRDEFLYARLGRATAVLLLLGLLVAAWPGWLQGAPYERRRWVVLADPSLKEAAEKLAEWRNDGQLAEEDRGFNFSPEEANYFAYFCPAEKGIVDARMQVSPRAAVDYVTVRRALLGEDPSTTAWRSILRARRITHMILYDSDPRREQAIYARLVQNDGEWFLLDLAGRCAIFGWKDPRQETAALKGPRRSLTAKVYYPTDAEKAPARWPGRGPQAAEWWQPFVTARPAGSLDRDRAALLLTQFKALRPPTLVARGRAWESSRIAAAAAAGSATLSLGLQQALDLYYFQALHGELPLDAKGRLTGLAPLALGLREWYFQQRDDAPPELLWLAIRAARRALHDNPDDAHAYLILGQAYLELAGGTRERSWNERIANGRRLQLRRLRQVQATTALHQALIREPDLLAAHDGLAQIYQTMGLWDLGLKHRREVLRLSQARGRSPGESVAQQQERLARLQKDVEQLANRIARVEERFEVSTANHKIIDRAEAAANYGLGGKALELLLASDAASFGKRGIMLELHLLLSTGRVRDVREWMSPDHRETLGDEIYLEDRVELAAACGDYAQADAELAALTALHDKPVALALFRSELSLRQAIALGVANEVLQSRLDKQSTNLHWPPKRVEMFRGTVRDFSGRLRRAANYTVLRGLLALERGDTTQARAFLARALETYHSGDGLDFEARPIAEHFEKVLSAPAK